MRIPRWLSALLIAALLLSSVPASVLAASSAPAPEQAPTVADASSYLLIVTPPTVSLPAQTRGMDAAGNVNIQHARRYAEVRAQLDMLQAQGAIAGYTELPAAYAFAVRSPDAAAQAQLAQFGRLQTTGDLTAASVDELSSAYSRQLRTAVASAVPPQPQAAQPHELPPPPRPTPERLPAPNAVAPAEVGATAATTPTFVVQLNNNYIYGWGEPDSIITFTLKTGSGVVKATATSVVDSDGYVYAYLYDIYSNAAYAVAGDVVEVQTPALITIPVVNLQVIPDVAAGRVTGFGPPNITSTDYWTPPNLEVMAPGGNFVTTDATGAFTDEGLLLTPGDSYGLVYIDEQWNRVTLSWGAPALAARGYYYDWYYSGYRGSNLVSGAVAASNVPVTVTLTRAGNPVVVNFVRSGNGGGIWLYLHDLYGNSVPILAGDTLQATDGLITISMDIKSFAVNSNPDTNTLSGTTNATVVTDTTGLLQTLSLWPRGTDAWNYGKTVMAPGGSFSATNPFYWYANPNDDEENLDWYPGDQGFLRYLDAQGNAVFDTFRAPTPAPVLYLRGSYYSYSSDNYVSGYVDSFCGYGIVTLLDSANVVKAQNSSVYTCYDFSTTFIDVYGNPVPIADGDKVTANFNGRTTTVTAPSLTMSAIPATDVVTGTITPGLVITTTPGARQSLAIYTYYWASQQNVQPDAAGKFSADFSGQVDIQPGDTGFAQYIDAQGNSVFARWQAPFDKPVLGLRGDGGYYAENFVAVTLPGYSCSDENGLELIVKAQDGTVRWQDILPVCGSYFSLYLEDAYGNDINLNPGDVVQATFAGQTTTVTVPSFVVTSDAESDTVSGITNATVVTTTAGARQTLAVWPATTYEESYGKHVAVTAGGVFSATNPFYYDADPYNWSTVLDWWPGAQGFLRYIDAGYNTVYATFAAKVDQPALSIRKDSNQVGGQVPDGNAPVTVTVKSGATVKGVGYATTNLTGWFSMDIFDGAGNPVEIAEGDEVVLSQPATTVAIPPLSANVDVANDRVSGKGPANALLNVYGEFPGYSVATDANGDYALDLRGSVDLRDGDWVGVEFKNAQGHRIWIGRYAGTTISAALNTNRVWVGAPDRNLPVTVTVKRGGTVIGTDSFVNDYYEFTAFPVDATGKPVVLAAGDVVEVDFGAGVAKSLTLAGMTVAVNEQANVVSGTGPANSLLDLSVEATPDWYDTSVQTAADGKWSVNLAAQMRDIRPGDIVSVRHSTNGADSTWLYGVAPVFYVRSGDNAVWGYAAPYAPVTITLKRNGGVLAVAYTEAYFDGFYFGDLYDVNNLSANIQAGDVVEVKSAQTVSVTVPTMTIVVNGPDRTVSGVGPANAMLGIFVRDDGYNGFSKTVQTDAGGAFSAGFAAQTAYDLVNAELRYREPQGNWIYANAGQRVGYAAYLQARWDADRYAYSAYAISGDVGAGPRQVTLSLRRGGQVVATAAAWGEGSTGDFTAYFHDAAGKTVDILAGDIIEMKAGDVTKSMTVPVLTVQTNLESDTLFGTGPANAQLYADTCGSTNVDAGGAWVLEECDLDNGDDGYVRVTDLLGNSTYLGWSIGQAWVHEYGNTVYGTSVLGAEVQVQLLRGGAVIAQASTYASAANGGFEVEFFTTGGSPMIIQPNDVVVVDAGEPITVPVTPLTAVVDTAADRITGVGPAGEQLVVYAAGVIRMPTVAADGSYIADFAGATDIRPGNWFDVEYMNDEGNGIWLGWNAPLVRINLGSDLVDGYATPNATAALVLKRGGSVVATAQAQTDSSGDFSAFFLDGSGNVIDLVAGDVVEVTASPTVAAAAIALTASLNAANDTVAGKGPAGAAILVVARRCYDTGCSETSLTAVANAAGDYTANFAGLMDLDQTSYAYVQATDAAGNQTSITTTPAETPQRTYVEGMVQAGGGSLLMSAYGTANSGNLTPPLSFNAVGGGRFIFHASDGDLVITAPNGTVTRTNNTHFVVENPATGTWKVQVEAWYGPGDQYAVAVGAAQYKIYLPAIQRQQQ